jgi:1,4-dihydroxy-2-naphthoate octaprenyltransferase
MSAYIAFQHFHGKPLGYQLFGILVLLCFMGLVILGGVIHDKFKK